MSPPNRRPESERKQRQQQISRLSRTALSTAGRILSDGITLPYYRFYRQNTLLPVLTVATDLKNGESAEFIAGKLQRWRDRKLHELQFVQVAGTLLAAAVIGCFSWAPKDEEHWLGPAAWYGSLVLSITAVLLSSSEAFILSAIKNAPPVSGSSSRLSQELSMILHVQNWNNGDNHDDDDNDPEGRSHHPVSHQGTGPVKVDIRWNMIFTWQAPIMLLGYSIIGFFMGLVIFVCTPLYDGHDGPYLNSPGKGAIFFIVWSAVSGVVFIWCSFWAYRFVSLDGL
ncbi:hypothetical protein B0H66DRAFT_565355 [Apodospora peruviana]|uniref:Uncharacterized protein n=1 Tax=Apodospora peruviana TaxID=516989 RepID=A0AAE0HZ12_9PEZI|nr:hypothetical protein B0H66DRAFT_565355 [Apodospora peruviana]